MNISVRLEQWNDTQTTIYYWEETFNINKNFELALGYIYRLSLVKPMNINDDRKNMTIREFSHIPYVRNYFLSNNAKAPNINETVKEYLRRTNKRSKDETSI